MLRVCLLALAASLVATSFVLAEGGEAFTDPAKAGPDFAIQGEYLGEIKTDNGMAKFGAQIIALGDGKFHAVVFPGGLPGEGWEGRYTISSKDIYPGYGAAPADWTRGAEAHQAAGKLVDGKALFENPEGKGVIVGGVMTISDSGGQELGQLKKVERKSPTLGEKPPAGAVVLFDGKSADKFQGGKMTDDGLLMVGVVGKQDFRDFRLHLEFRTPFMPKSREQGRGNSGMYLQHRYEVQILDSFGQEGRNNECSGLYSQAAPKLNMCLPPLSWQTYDVDFTAARYNDKKEKTSKARVTLKFNGVVVYDNLELPTLTPGGAPEEFPGAGPLHLQDHGNPVHFRNIWVVEKK